MPRYFKPRFSIEGEIQELFHRGLVISDIFRAREEIRRIGYYRLTGYLHPFRKKDVRRMSSLVSGVKQPG